MNQADPKTASAGAKGETERVELGRAEQTLVRRMAESKATVPHSYLRAAIDMSRAVEIRRAFAVTAGDGPVPDLEDMVIKATALALREHPRANGSYRDGGIELYSRINVGFGIATPDSLVFPTITDADRLDLAGIASERRRLSEEAREGRMTASGSAGGTFTVFSLSGFGLRDFDPIIHGGQAGMLALGEVAEQPIAHEGELGTGQLMEVSLAGDHRILYGAHAAGFLAAVRSNLEEPDRLA